MTDRQDDPAGPADDATSGSVTVLPGYWRLFRTPLPNLPKWRSRVVVKIFALLARRQLSTVYGAEHVTIGNDPFILAINHNIRREAMLVPGIVAWLRGGRLIHFMADWSYMLIPGIGWSMRHAEVIVVTTKPARPAFLNAARPLFLQKASAAEITQQHLADGNSIGVFPEGTYNRDPNKLLYGRAGMAQLSLQTGVPVVPLGIRFPDVPRDRPIPENARMEVHIGPPMQPPALDSEPKLSAVRDWHAAIMTELARLSGKTWSRDKASNRKPVKSTKKL